jgi:ABC-type uncharacterized transport system ATPase subunit
LGGREVFAAAGRRADAALEQPGLSAIADRPAGLLSHGDQRLLEVAMGLAQEPRPCWMSRPRACRSSAQAVETSPGFSPRAYDSIAGRATEVVFRLAHRITVLHAAR